MPYIKNTSRVLPSISSLHRKKDSSIKLSRSQIDHQTNHHINNTTKRQNKLTHFQNNSLAKSDTFSQKSIASRSKSPIAPKSAIKNAPVTNETSATSTTSATSATNSKHSSQEERAFSNLLSWHRYIVGAIPCGCP